MSSFAASSSLFGLPRAAAAGPSSSSASARAPLLIRRSFGRSPAVQAPYKTSTGQTAILPVFVPKRPGGAACMYKDYEFIDARPLQQRVYPFSKTALVPFIPPVPKPKSAILPPSGTSKLQHINTSLRLSQDPNSYHYLFNRKDNPQTIRVGSILTVSSWTTAAKTHATNFTGVLIAVRRGGAETTFTLRNVVLRTGVEMKYHCSSPLLREVKLIKQADGKPGNIRKHRTAKLYYYRDQPERLAAAASAIKSTTKTNAKAQAGTTFI